MECIKLALLLLILKKKKNNKRKTVGSMLERPNRVNFLKIGFKLKILKLISKSGYIIIRFQQQNN